MLKLIVFDCDGVMFDSREANRKYYDDLLGAFGYPEMSEAEVSYTHMHNVTDSVNHIFRHYPEQEIEEVQRLRAGRDYTPYLELMTMEPDLPAFLTVVKSRYNLAISTNRTNTMRPLLKAFDLYHFFDMIVTAADVENPKPAPDALLDILSHFNCSATESIYIGDSIIDQQHTKSIGVPFIAFKDRSLDAHYHVDNFTEILHLKPFQS
jgi:phosphoglycolate phosphatase